MKHRRVNTVMAIALPVMACVGAACGTGARRSPPGAGAAASTPTPGDRGPAPESTPTPTDVWLAILLKTPYPYTTPLPPPDATVLDGTYTKFDPKPATPVPCRRCPDYAPEGGLWKLNLAKGVFRILHTVTGWRSVGSFAVSGNQIALFNDPYCVEEAGLYTWRLAGGYLTFEVIEDPCAIRLRAANFTSLPWASCQPPSLAAALSDQWLKPLGC